VQNIGDIQNIASHGQIERKHLELKGADQKNNAFAKGMR
jgi:hypothetical protein